MVKGQDPDNLLCVSMQARCARELAAYDFKMNIKIIEPGILSLVHSLN